MAIDQAGKAAAMPDDKFEATVAIVTAHLRTRPTAAAQVPELIQQVHKDLSDLADRGSRNLGTEDQQLRQLEAMAPSRADTSDAELRRIAEEDAVFPWSGPPGLRGSSAGTRIGDAPRERFRSRCR
jgi:hypothetical protein